jgi:hypothetical protein
MRVHFKSLLLAVSLLLNGIFIALCVFAFTSRTKTSHLSFPAPPDGYSTAAAVISVPPAGTAVFDLVEITLKPREKAFLQFSVISGAQGNLILNAVYDHDVITITQTGYGIEITALQSGSTLMQTLTADGIKNVALINVNE